MTKVLSDDEIAELLKAISSGTDEPDETHQIREKRNIRIWDFRRPDVFTRNMIRKINKLHNRFTALVNNEMEKVDVSFHVHVASIDQLTYEEFMRSIPWESSTCVGNNNELGNFLIDIPNCTNKDIKGYLLSESVLNDSLDDVWSCIGAEYVTIKAPEKSSIISPICREDEMGCLVTMEVSVCKDETKKEKDELMFNIFYPFSCFSKETRTFLNSDYDTQVIKKQKIEETGMQEENSSLGDVQVKMDVRIGSRNIPLHSLYAAGEGTMIELDKVAGEPADIYIGDVKFAEGEIVVIDEQFGIRITDIVADNNLGGVEKC